MTCTEQRLLGLLGRALFGSGAPLPPDTDWKALFQEAVSHSVYLLTYDCLTKRERAAIPSKTTNQ